MNGAWNMMRDGLTGGSVAADEAGPWQLHLLGPPVLIWQGQAVTGRMAARQEALLYALAAHSHPWPRSRLASLLWGDQGEAPARANLRVALTRLRQRLPGILVVDHRGVGLDSTRLMGDLLALRRAHCPAQPLADRLAAFFAWRGPFLEGFELGGADGFEHWLAEQRQRLRTEASALGQALSVELEAIGDVDTALAVARQRVVIDAADEPAHMIVMRLLVAQGQRCAALAQYAACRIALAEQLGARPSAACHALYVRIHAESLVVVEHPMELAAPPLLPGHASVLVRLDQRLDQPACRWLTLYGPPGIGKTALAREAVRRWAPRFRLGVCWIDASAPAGADCGVEWLAAWVARRVGDRAHAPQSLLLVLDGLDPSVWPPEAVAATLAALPGGVRVLATARRPLHGADEWRQEIEAVRPDDAPAVFQHCARRMGIELAGVGEPAALKRLCERCGGWPLALDAAAQLLATLTLPELVAWLDGAVNRTLPEVARAWHEAWYALPLATQAAVRRLACLGEPLDPLRPGVAEIGLEHLGRLREHGWLQRADDDGGLVWSAWVRSQVGTLAGHLDANRAVPVSSSPRGPLQRHTPWRVRRCGRGVRGAARRRSGSSVLGKG